LALLEESSDSFGTAFVEPLVILLILVANATVGVVQESNAERAIDVSSFGFGLGFFCFVHCMFISQALKEYSPDEAKVIRSSQIGRIHASELVPGDIISVAVGDRIPADCRLLSVASSSFRMDQAILTGEATSVNKSVEAVVDASAVKQDMNNMLFAVNTHSIICNGIALTNIPLGYNCSERKCTSHRRVYWSTYSYWRYSQVNHLSDLREDPIETTTR
jgi:Ca2+ transporting ATPase